MEKAFLPLSKKERRAVILVTQTVPCLFTLKKILDSSCIVNGVIFCDKKGMGERIKKEKHNIKKCGFIKRLSQVLLSICRFLIESRSDKAFLKECYGTFSLDEVFNTMELRNIEYIHTSDFESDTSLKFIKKKNPDFLVSHTPFWIGKKVRQMPNEKITIGAHPGLVPLYRGAHSPFWCMYDKEPDKNGYSIFCLNHGVDSGPLIAQEKIDYRKDITYLSNDYFLMKLISIAQARIAESYSKGNALILTPPN